MIMTPADIAIIVVCCAVVIAVVTVAIVRRKRGKTACGCGDCASCTACHHCETASEKSVETSPEKEDEATRQARRDAFLQSLLDGHDGCDCSLCGTRTCACNRAKDGDKTNKNTDKS